MLAERKARLSLSPISAKSMQQFWLLTLIAGSVLIESQYALSERSLRMIINIKYRFGSNYKSETLRTSVRAQVYSFDTNEIESFKGRVMDVKCTRGQTMCKRWLLCINNNCTDDQFISFSKSYNFIVCQWRKQRIEVIAEDTQKQLTYFLTTFSKHNDSRRWAMNISFEIPGLIGGSGRAPSNFFSPTSLFGIIFLTACVVIVLGFFAIWIFAFYYRQLKDRRMKRKLRQAIARSVQQTLDSSPIISYDPSAHENDFTDNDPICAICLESFKAKENVRKLVCSHYFHVPCIDPWLLIHHSCPLCNRSILSGSISSISAQVMPSTNENNRATETLPDHRVVMNDNDNRAFQPDSELF